jgi:hypothetical protein
MHRPKKRQKKRVVKASKGYKSKEFVATDSDEEGQEVPAEESEEEPPRHVCCFRS